MSSRPQLKPFHCVANGDLSASLVSTISAIGQLTYIGYSLSWTGTPTGTFSVQVCNDAQFDSNGAYIAGTGSWVNLILSATIVASGSADTAFIDIDGVAAAWIRLAYTRSSGTGVLNATVAGKCA